LAAGAGSNGLLAGAEPPGAIGIEFSGALAGAACTGTGTRRPSKMLPLMRLVEEYARNSEVRPKSSAKVHVSLKSGLTGAPRAEHRLAGTAEDRADVRALALL